MTPFLVIILSLGQTHIAPPDSFVYPLRTDPTTELEFVVFPPPQTHLPLFYKIDWGDGETLDWTEPLRYLVDITRYHRYSSPGKYCIRVMAKDSAGNISPWSQACSVEVIPALVKWFAPTSGAVIAAPALDEIGNVYIGDENGIFYSFSPNGDLRWTFPTRGPIHAAATIQASLIYLPTLDSHLYCLDTNGKLRWSINLENELWTPATVTHDGSIYIVNDNGTLFALTPQGKVRWRINVGDEATSSPTIGPDNLLYIAADSVYCFTLKGKRRWVFGAGEETYFFAAPVPDIQGGIRIGCSDGYIYALRPDGKIRWRIPVPDEDEIRTEIVYGPDGTMFFGTDGYYLCSKSETGRMKIVYEANDVLCATPAISAQGTVYILPDDGTFYAFTSYGRLLFKLDVATGDKSIYYTSSPTIGPDGTVYIGSWDGGVYAFQGDAPPNRSLWPQFRQNAQHTGVQKKTAGKIK
ncbi:MAG: PQQ-binding-like beta-propeller repeat protein [bacterium]